MVLKVGTYLTINLCTRSQLSQPYTALQIVRAAKEPRILAKKVVLHELKPVGIKHLYSFRLKEL